VWPRHNKYPMPTFIGFNTIGQFRKFTLTDAELVKRDLLNSLNIQQGSLPGRPDVGTTLWSYLFENQTPEVVETILRELQRLIAQDPRLLLVDAQVYPQENGMQIELQVQIVPDVAVQTLSVAFDQNTQTARAV